MHVSTGKNVKQITAIWLKRFLGDIEMHHGKHNSQFRTISKAANGWMQ